MQYVNNEQRRQDILGESLSTEKYWIKSGGKKEIVKMVFFFFFFFMSFYCFVQYLHIWSTLQQTVSINRKAK